MINRSKIKYSLKKLLPEIIFVVVLNLWKNIFIRAVDATDNLRLKNFIDYHSKIIAHHGHKFSLFISPENGFIDQHIYLYGTYEPHILDVIAKYLKSGDVFVDIGANIGQHSMFAASIIGDSGKVYSFEPIPRIHKQLLDSVKNNHFEKIVHTFNIALGEEDRVATFYIDGNNIGGSSIIKADRLNSSEITVKIKRGDDVLKDIGHISMIKIDVEGYEHEALMGIQRTIIQYKPIILLEFSGEMYSYKGKNDGEKIISFLEEAGYEIYDVENYMKKIDSKEHFLSEFIQGKVQCDILCLPKN